MQIVYIPSESMSVQGKKDEIYKRYGKDWNIREQGGGNGNWLLTRKSDVLVDGKSYRTFVLEHYGKSKQTQCHTYARNKVHSDNMPNKIHSNDEFH